MSTWQIVVVVLMGAGIISAWMIGGELIELLRGIAKHIESVDASASDAGTTLHSIDLRQRWLHGHPSKKALQAMDQAGEFDDD